MLNFSIFLFCIIQCTVGYLVNYYLHDENGISSIDCIDSAIARIMRETCVVFKKNPNAHNAIFIIESRRCGVQESNSTVHLGNDCLTPDACLQFIQHAITGEKKHHTEVIRHLNLKYNCSDKCTTVCENNGAILSNCTCKCNYGFTGANCERLKLNDQFTDSSCGFIENVQHGEIALKNIADKNTFCQWVLKSNNPFQTFEIEIEQLDLNNEDSPLGQNCGDFLYIFGAKNIQNPIPCNPESLNEDGESKLVGTKFKSTSNFLFIEYRGNRLASKQSKGPIFKFNTINEHSFNNEFPSLKYEHISAGTVNGCFNLSVAITIICSTILLIFFNIII